MEGVVVVEMSSGALHYTRSFSDEFDVRHPKTERLNLGALIFALQNFAGSSICPTDNQGTVKGLQSGVADIVIFSTPQENMVFATTPSSKLLVVLFTTPEFDADVAKWVASRVAFNYEKSDDTPTNTINQVPRHFRQAFSEAIDKAVEQNLVSLSETILIHREDNNNGAEESVNEELFLFFYYSPRLDKSESDSVNKLGDKCARTIDRPDNLEEEYRNAVRVANPTISEVSRNTERLTIRNMIAFTRKVVAAAITCASCKKKRSMKKTRWKSRNAVMHHTESHEFQRVIEIHSRERNAALMDPDRTGKVYGIADVLLPFVELSAFPNNKVTQSHKLNHLVWTNIPSVSSKQQGGITTIVAWRRGPCCVFYPVTAMCLNPENKLRTRLAITALFDVLEPLLKAKNKILV